MKRFCQVCDESGAQIHYNGRVCNSCRVFFSRSARTQIPEVCIANGDCKITVANRTDCNYCRYKRCFQVMDVKLVGLRRDKERGARANIVPTASWRDKMTHYHHVLALNAPVFNSTSIDIILSRFKSSLSQNGPLPVQSNLNINLAALLEDPTQCCDRSTAAFYYISCQKPLLYDKFGAMYGRWLVCYADFLKSTTFFNYFSKDDQIKLAREKFNEFLTFIRLKYYQAKYWKPYHSIFPIPNYLSSDLCVSSIRKCRSIFKCFSTQLLNLHLDEIEFMSIKLIAMFNNPLDLSEEGLVKAFFVKEVIAKKLSQHILDTYPELSKEAHFDRLHSLLEFVTSINAIGATRKSFYTAMFAHNYEGMAGLLSYEMHVKTG